MDGFRPLVPETAGGRIVLECRRVAASDRDRQAIVVPCLGGLSAQDLMEAAGTGAAIVVADHGWCAACPVSHRADPWGAALDETKALFSTISAQLAGAIGVERRDLAPDRARPVMAALRPDKQVGRRDLLRRLTGTTERRDSLAESRRVIAGRGLVKPIKRRRLVKQISALAASRGMPMPPGLVPAVMVRVVGCSACRRRRPTTVDCEPRGRERTSPLAAAPLRSIHWASAGGWARERMARLPHLHEMQCQ